MSRTRAREGQRMTMLRKLRLERGFDQQTLAFTRLTDGLALCQTEVSRIERYGFGGGVSDAKVEVALPVFARVLGYEGDPRDLLEEVRY